MIWLRVRPPGWLGQRGVDLFGERVAGRVLQRPVGGAGGVVPERERRLEMLGLDGAFAVGERVDQRESDDVCFCAGADRAGDPALVCVRELGVGVVPQLTRGGLEGETSGGARVLDRGAEQALQAGAGERVAGSAFGQQPLPSTADEQEPVREPVGELKAGEVVAQLGGGDVPDNGHVSVAGAGRCGACHQLQRATVPRGAQGCRECRVIARAGLQGAGELCFERDKPPVRDAGI